MSQLKSDSELETSRFRQAVYVNFTKNHCIPDPCGNEPGYEYIIVFFFTYAGSQFLKQDCAGIRQEHKFTLPTSKPPHPCQPIQLDEHVYKNHHRA